MKDTGSRTSCMVRVSTLGRMGASTSVTTKTIRKVAKELSTGPTAASTRAAGKRENSMERLYSQPQIKSQERACGRRANASRGSLSLSQMPT